MKESNWELQEKQIHSTILPEEKPAGHQAKTLRSVTENCELANSIHLMTHCERVGSGIETSW